MHSDCRSGSTSLMVLRALLAIALAGGAACAGPPTAAPGEILGVGTPGVSSYLARGDDDTLQAELDRCRASAPPSAGSRPNTLDAACDQLRRTLRNQPGNAIGGTGRP